MGTEMQDWRREALTGIAKIIKNVAADFAALSASPDLGDKCSS